MATETLKYIIEEQEQKVGFNGRHVLLSVSTEMVKNKPVEKRTVMIRGTRDVCEDYKKMLEEK